LRGEFFDTQAIGDWNLQLQVNVVGCARVAKTMLPLLLEARGRLVNVASVAGLFGTEGTVSYNASKFAVVGMSDALRRELGGWGVTVRDC
jgi:NAD(P)-dependent dehydrogenase (short-subunit alcohol dehydrogenase family)